MQNYQLVLTEHLNHYGYLFGGNMLKWIDEFSWIAASLEYPGCEFVTIGMDRVTFKESITNGTILRFSTEKQKEGNTSVTYTARVYARAFEKAEEKEVFSTHVTFVCLGKDGKKRPLRQENLI